MPVAFRCFDRQSTNAAPVVLRFHVSRLIVLAPSFFPFASMILHAIYILSTAILSLLIVRCRAACPACPDDVEGQAGIKYLDLPVTPDETFGLKDLRLSAIFTFVPQIFLKRQLVNIFISSLARFFLPPLLQVHFVRNA